MHVIDLYKNHISAKVIVANVRESDYGWNIFIVFLFIVVILFLYVKNNISVDEKNWDIKKCNPKYVFFSGYIRRNPNESSYDTTVNNFYECAENMARGANDNLADGALGDGFNYFKDKVVQFDASANENHEALMKNMEMKQENISKQLDDLAEDVSLNMNNDTAFTYTYLKNIGIYVDKLNGFIDFANQYIRQILTYKMMEHASECINDESCYKDKNEGHSSYQNAIKIRNILNEYYGGPNIS